MRPARRTRWRRQSWDQSPYETDRAQLVRMNRTRRSTISIGAVGLAVVCIQLTLERVDRALAHRPSRHGHQLDPGYARVDASGELGQWRLAEVGTRQSDPAFHRVWIVASVEPSREL